MAVPYLSYANQSATRRLPLNPKLIDALGFLPELGVTMEVFSGGQPPAGQGPRVGSTRHDHGNAADVFFYRDGRKLDWANPQDRPIFEEIVRRGKAAGITGFGAGEGYMQPGSMHIGFGNEAVWGAGGKGANAPDWLRTAYANTSSAPAPKPLDTEQQAFVQNNPQPGGYGPGIDDPNAPPSQGILPGSSGGILAGGIPQDVAAYATRDDKKKKGILGGIFDALQQVPDAPAPRLGPMPDARRYGGLLNDFLEQPGIAQRMLKRRLG